MKIKWFWLFGLAFVVIACSQKGQATLGFKDPADSANTSRAEKLSGKTEKAWQIKSFTVDGQDMLAGLKSCELDNLDVYYASGVYESHEGNTKCNPADQDIRRRGKWALNEDSTSVDVKLGNSWVSLKILELSDQKFHYTSINKGHVTEAVLTAADASKKQD